MERGLAQQTMTPGSRAIRRVVVENFDGAERWVESDILREAGFDVSACSGPEGAPCPLVAGEGCRLIGTADAVISSLRPDRPDDRDVLEAIRTLHPDTALIVEAPRIVAERHEDLLDGAIVVYPLTATSMLAALHDAAGSEPDQQA